MINRTAGTNSFNTVAFGRVGVTVTLVLLFAVMLLLGLFVPLRYAHGWVEVFSAGALNAAPMAADAIVGMISASATAVAIAWIYIRHLN